MAELQSAAQTRCPDLPIGSLDVWAGGTWELIQQVDAPVQVQFEMPAQPELPMAGEPTGTVWRGPMRRTDRCGGVWERVGEGSGDSPLFGHVSSIPVSNDADILDLSPEPQGESSFQAWYTSNCDGSGLADHKIHDAEDRVEISNFGYRAQKASVTLYFFRRYFFLADFRLASDGQCSGTMLDDDYVLTAGHCLATLDSSGNNWVGEREAALVLVCSRGNRSGTGASCSTASHVIVNPGFISGSTNGDIDQDWAVATLSSPVVGPNETMALSSASPATWDDYLLRNMAYPGFEIGFDPPLSSKPTCNSNSRPAQQATFADPSPGSNATITIGGMALFRGTRSGADTNYNTTLAKTRLDNANGASGSSYFICPSENCDNVPEVVALHTAYKSIVSHRHRGPRVNLFKTWVENNAP